MALRWRAEHLEYIQANYRDMSDRDIANQLCQMTGTYVTKNAVQAKRQEMGIILSIGDMIRKRSLYHKKRGS